MISQLHRARAVLLFSVAVVLCVSKAPAQEPKSLGQSTAFTYQGRLTDGGIPASGIYDLQFQLVDGGGNPQGAPNPNTITGVQVTAGVFTVTLDYGANAFPGADRFLQISIKHPVDLSYTVLSPQQQITGAPYALRSLSASSADFTVNFSGPLAGDVTGTQGATVVAFVGGQSAFDVANGTLAANGATDTNTGSTLVKRDGNGNFSAGVINVAGAYNVGGSPVVRLSGLGSNTHLGPFAGGSVTSGMNDTFVGQSAGSAITSGSNNTFLGAGTGGFGTLNNITVIGAGALATQSNSLVLGGVNGQNGVTADTNVGIGTTAPAARLDIGVNSTHVLLGDAGCFSGFAGIGFKALSGCANYSLLGNGTSTMINRPTGGGIFFRENNLDQMAIASGGLVGIGTNNPRTQLEISKDQNGGLGPSLTLANSQGGVGAGASIDFDSYQTGGAPPTARIQNVNDGNLSDSLSFQTKAPGGIANPLVERLRINSTGTVSIPGAVTLSGGATIGTGIGHDGGGFKHARVNVTLAQAPANDFIHITWGTPFADTNYTVVAAVEDTNLGQVATGIIVRGVINKTQVSVDVAISNNSNTTHTGVIHVIAVHD